MLNVRILTHLDFNTALFRDGLCNLLSILRTAEDDGDTGTGLSTRLRNGATNASIASGHNDALACRQCCLPSQTSRTKRGVPEKSMVKPLPLGIGAMASPALLLLSLDWEEGKRTEGLPSWSHLRFIRRHWGLRRQGYMHREHSL